MSRITKVSKKTIQHKTVVFLGHMNDNSNFTFPMKSSREKENRNQRVFKETTGLLLQSPRLLLQSDLWTSTLVARTPAAPRS